MKSEFENYLNEHKQRVLQRTTELTPEVFPPTLYEPVRYALAAGGKLLRPVLLLISCEAVGGKIEDALDAAVALEMVHTFSLVHDDIMDNDELRRGRQTVHKKWDTALAILAGDAILIKAYDAFRRVDPRHLPRAFAEFNQAILEVCEGQALDMAFEQRRDVTVDDYFYMIDRKTGRLFSAACALGALLGGGSEAQIDAMRTFGSRIGRAFQVQDDLLDLTADQALLGKDIGSDLQEDKKTFLMLYAREHADETQNQRLQALQQKAQLDDADLQQAIALLTEIGAVSAARQEIDAALNEAFEALNLLTAAKPRAALAQLVDFIRNREF
mgnify:FL=1